MYFADSFIDGLAATDVKVVYEDERRAFKRMTKSLDMDRNSSAEVVALWNWFELHGYEGTVKRALSLPKVKFYQLADDTLGCIDVLVSDFVPDELMLFHLLPFLGRPFSAEYVQANRMNAIESINWFVNKVCIRSFDGDDDEFVFEEDEEDDGFDYYSGDEYI